MTDTIIIDLPAGTEKSRFTHIFNPRNIGIFDGTGIRERYCLTVNKSILPDDLKGVHFNRKSNTVLIESLYKPLISIIVDGRTMDIEQSAHFLDLKFHDLHWINSTPDLVVNSIPKKIAALVIKREIRGQAVTLLKLRAVQMNASDIEESLSRRPTIFDTM